MAVNALLMQQDCDHENTHMQEKTGTLIRGIMLVEPRLYVMVSTLIKILRD